MECIASCSSRAKPRTCSWRLASKFSMSSVVPARPYWSTAVLSWRMALARATGLPRNRRTAAASNFPAAESAAGDDEVAQHDEERRTRLGRPVVQQLDDLRLDAQQQRVRVAGDEGPLADHPVELVVVALERGERVVRPVDVEAGDDRVGARGARPRADVEHGHHLRTSGRVRAAVLLHRRRQLAPVRDAESVDLREGMPRAELPAARASSDASGSCGGIGGKNSSDATRTSAIRVVATPSTSAANRMRRQRRPEWSMKTGLWRSDIWWARGVPRRTKRGRESSPAPPRT